MAQMFKIDGQDVTYNAESKVLRFTIQEPFWTAGVKLGWDEPSAGIGINRAIIKFTEKMRCHLIVHLESANQDFFINYDKLMEFMRTNRTEWTVPKGVTVHVISVSVMPEFVRRFGN